MVKLCKHLKDDGNACHSPAVLGEAYCCHHLLYKGHRLRTWRIPVSPPWRLRLPPFDSLSNVQLSLERIGRAEAAGHFDPSTVGLLRYALRLAASNLRAMSADARLRSPAIQRNADAGSRSPATSKTKLGIPHPREQPE